MATTPNTGSELPQFGDFEESVRIKALKGLVRVFGQRSVGGEAASCAVPPRRGGDTGTLNLPSPGALRQKKQAVSLPKIIQHFMLQQGICIISVK